VPVCASACSLSASEPEPATQAGTGNLKPLALGMHCSEDYEAGTGTARLALAVLCIFFKLKPEGDSLAESEMNF
jgi:hypothetical protein